MRGEKKKLDGTFPSNILEGLPYYSPHLVRTVITLVNIPSVPEAGISTMLAHSGDEAAGPSLQRVNSTSQTKGCQQNADAVAAWRDALRAGGKPPRPAKS
jgi:NADH:ubiquinone oxidoreductase subunit F (NADH-binding)